jgi:hypothetical protein
VARNARLARLRLIPVVGVVGAVLAVSGCAAGQISQTAQQVAAIDGANGNAGLLGVRDARLAPTEEYRYEAGADVPVKLWLTNESLTADSLTSVTTEAADEVVITGDTEVQPQTSREVTEEGDTTIVVTGLNEELPYGKSIPMTFTFASSGSFTVNVPIEIPEERSTEPRETIDILPPHPGNIWHEDSEGSEGSGGAGEGAGGGH